MGLCGSSVAGALRDDWQKFEFDGVKDSKLRVIVCTWNVGNTIPNTDELSIWIPNDRESEVDMIVIGCQEMQFKVAGAKDDATIDEKRTCEDHMREILDKHLNRNYNKVTDVELGEMHMFVFIAKQKQNWLGSADGGARTTANDLKPGDTKLGGELRNLELLDTGTVVCGIGNIIDNKGATICALEYMGVRLCFVNSHLAAHQEYHKRRDEDHRRILRVNDVGTRNMELQWNYDHVIWMGDLNYRLDYVSEEHGPQGLDKSPSKELFAEISAKIQSGSLNELFAVDQLSKSIREGSGWRGFQEGNVPEFGFLPTFKVEKGAGLTYKDKRSQAWCDRVLWRTRDETTPDAIKCKEYTAFPDVSTSDHKPVQALLEIDVPAPRRMIDTEKPPLSLKFYNLQAHGIRAGDIGGTSDAFIKFMGNKNGKGPRGLISGDSVKTHTHKTLKVKKKDEDGHDLKSEWQVDKMEEIKLAANNPEFLKKEFLLFALFDEDTASADDYLGCGAIPLRQAIEKPNTQIKFKVPIEYDGQPAGDLHGAFAIKEGDMRRRTKRSSILPTENNPGGLVQARRR